MIKKIKAWVHNKLNTRVYVKDLESRIDFLKEDRVNLIKNVKIKDNVVSDLKKNFKHRNANPIEVVKAITDEEFQFFDYNELPDNEKKKYYDQAQLILGMDAFVNEVSKLNKEWMTWTTKQSRDFEGVLAMRHQISGLNLLKQRLEEIPNPEQPKQEVKEPYANI